MACLRPAWRASPRTRPGAEALINTTRRTAGCCAGYRVTRRSERGAATAGACRTSGPRARRDRAEDRGSNTRSDHANHQQAGADGMLAPATALPDRHGGGIFGPAAAPRCLPSPQPSHRFRAIAPLPGCGAAPLLTAIPRPRASSGTAGRTPGDGKVGGPPGPDFGTAGQRHGQDDGPAPCRTCTACLSQRCQWILLRMPLLWCRRGLQANRRVRLAGLVRRELAGVIYGPCGWEEPSALVAGAGASAACRGCRGAD